MKLTSHEPFVKYEDDGNTLPVLAFEEVQVDDKYDLSSVTRTAWIPFVPHEGELVRADSLGEYEIVLSTDKEVLHG